MRLPFGELPPGTIFIHESTPNHPGLRMIKLHNPERWARRDEDYREEEGAQLNAVCLTSGVPSPIDPKTRVIVVELPRL